MTKKIALALGLALGLSQLVYGDVPAVSPNTPAAVNYLADGLHILDNGTGATLRDVLNGVWFLGVETTVYKKWYLSLDVGTAYPVSVANAHANYYVNGRAWVGQFLYDKVPQVHSIADQTAFTAKLLQYGTVGWWGMRDFDYGIYRTGFDAGLTVKFGAAGQVTGLARAGHDLPFLSRLNLYDRVIVG